jgi:hypothetical protein
MVKRILWKKVLFSAFVLTGLLAVPRPAMAAGGGCTTDLLDCYTRAAKIDSFWYRSAAGLDCEIDYTGCVRRRVLGA